MQYMQVGLNYLSHLSVTHKPIRSRVREIRQLCLSDTYTTYSESREKAYSHEDPKIPHMRNWKVSYKETLSFI